jgi:hypothetical protein
VTVLATLAARLTAAGLAAAFARAAAASLLAAALLAGTAARMRLTACAATAAVALLFFLFLSDHDDAPSCSSAACAGRARSPFHALLFIVLARWFILTATRQQRAGLVDYALRTIP